MKILSLFFFTVLLIWSWNVSTRTPAVDFATHASIQNKLIEFIQNYIQQKKPNITDYKIQKIWTETVNEKEVKATFRHSFSEVVDGEKSTSEVESQMVLRRVEDVVNEQGESLENWQIVHSKTTSDAIQFEDGLIITSGSYQQGSTIENQNSEPQENKEPESH
jgi:hypothetical protein